MTDMKSVIANTKDYVAELEDTRRQRDNYWILLRKLTKEYKYIHDLSPIDMNFTFTEYVEKNYGIMIQYNNDGLIAATFTISDPAKYTFCLLKHT